MTTVETLFVQIFERKNSIVEQVKQQTNSYTQHLASKLLVDGIAPPTWLWNPDALSDSKEPIKEELVTRILCPHPKVSLQHDIAQFPSYNAEGSSYGLSFGDLAFDERTGKGNLTAERSQSGKDHVVYALKFAATPDGLNKQVKFKSFECDTGNPKTPHVLPEVGTNSLQKTLVGLNENPESNLTHASLIGHTKCITSLTRSRSRQKALEIRSKAKSLANTRSSSCENDGVCSVQVVYSPLVSKLVEDTVLKSPDPAIITHKKTEDPDLVNGLYKVPTVNAEIRCSSNPKERSSSFLLSSKRQRRHISDFKEDNPYADCTTFPAEICVSSSHNCEANGPFHSQTSMRPLRSIIASDNQVSEPEALSHVGKAEHFDVAHLSGLSPEIVNEPQDEIVTDSPSVGLLCGLPQKFPNSVDEQAIYGKFSKPRRPVVDEPKLTSVEKTLLIQSGKHCVDNGNFSKSVRPVVDEPHLTSDEKTLNENQGHLNLSCSGYCYHAGKNVQLPIMTLSVSPLDPDPAVLSNTLIDAVVDQPTRSPELPEDLSLNVKSINSENDVNACPGCGIIAHAKTRNVPTHEPEVSCIKCVNLLHHQEFSSEDTSLKAYKIRLLGGTLALDRIFRYANRESWPPSKKVKIQDKITNDICTSPRLRIRKPRNIDENAVACVHTDANEQHTVYTLSGEKSGILNGKTKSSQESLTEEITPMRPSRDHFSAGQLIHGKVSQHLSSPENMDDRNSKKPVVPMKMSKGSISPNSKSCRQARHSDIHPSNIRLKSTDPDQCIPELERFVLDEQTDGNKEEFGADEIYSEGLSHPQSTVHLVNRSSNSTPVSHLKSKVQIDGTLGLSDDLERWKFGSSLIYDTGFNDQGMSFFGSQYGFRSGNRETSLVRKLQKGRLSRIGSSKKNISNPEFTCFSIKEDPSTSEENDAVENVNMDSSTGYIDDRTPMKDVKNSGVLLHSVSEIDDPLKPCDTKRLTSRSTSPEKHCEARLSCQYHSRNRKTTRDKENSSVRVVRDRTTGHKLVTKLIKTGTKSIIDCNSIPVSLKYKQGGNIVSNINSFIPLMQQKQAAGFACAGKREFKVKALEVAEAAKRHAEKREIERQRKKEAWKQEREKLAERKLRQVEKEKKEKEEKRKRKNADIIEKKRLLAEEEKKHNKRLRLDMRVRQREQEEKRMLTDNAEEKSLPKENTKEEFYSELKKQERNNAVGADDLVSETECFEAGKDMIEDKSPKENDNRMNRTSHSTSYEISPYQSSDDEDCDSDGMRQKKRIPSWASKSCVGLLISQQQEMDPDLIFPVESFSNVDNSGGLQ